MSTSQTGCSGKAYRSRVHQRFDDWHGIKPNQEFEIVWCYLFGEVILHEQLLGFVNGELATSCPRKVLQNGPPAVAGVIGLTRVGNMEFRFVCAHVYDVRLAFCAARGTVCGFGQGTRGPGWSHDGVPRVQASPYVTLPIFA
eukprot:1392513-Amorphochlora_amoeboformis.AAC.2